LINYGSKITLIDVASRKEPKKWKSITFEISNCQIYISPFDDWICFIMNKKEKIKEKIKKEKTEQNKKKSKTLIIHVGNLKRREIETTEELIKDRIISYTFSPESKNLVIISES